MKITRKKFLKLSSLTLAGLPVANLSCARQIGGETAGSLSLHEGFKNPPGSARPFVRWWWNGNKLTEDEILRELDLLKEAGIGGVEINSIKFPEHADSIGLSSYEWLSGDWTRMVNTAVQGAHKRGLTCDIIVGSGWPFGGKFLDREEQTQLLTYETKELEGSSKVSFTREELLETVDLELHSKNEDLLKELAFLRLAPASMEKFESGEDLTDELQQDIITIDVPEGKYVLYYLVKFTGFQSVINGAPGADGPVLNHYNKKAVRKYLDRMSDRLAPALGGLGDAFRAMFCDSLELEGANWNSDMLEEFKNRRGYDLYLYLPFVLYKTGHMGNPVKNSGGTAFSEEVQGQIHSVRYDFYRTRLELFKERFIDTFQQWCEEQGVKSRVQAYGRGYHPVEASMEIDIPECETWLRPPVGGDSVEKIGLEGRAYSMINKFVSSGARLAGKKRISCEEITNTEMVFNATLEDIKIAGDQSNLSGVTHSILHGFNYSPEKAPFPGWVRYGTFFNEQNAWWPFFKRWIGYKARLSYIFQQAEMVSDIAVMHPLSDMWMKFGPQRDPFPVINYPEYQHNVWEAIHQNGNGCDYISEKILQNASCEDGRLQYGGRSYKALMLLEAETLLPESARSLQRFARAGGTIIFVGKEPRQSPGLVNKEENNQSVKQIIRKIKQEYSGKVSLVSAPGEDLLTWYLDIQQEFDLEPYITFDRPSPYVSQVHYRSDDKDFFFIVNYSRDKQFSLQAEFHIDINAGNRTPWLWNPETGERTPYPWAEKSNRLGLTLGPGESKLIVFEKGGGREPDLIPATDSSKPTHLLKGPWDLELHHVNGEQEQVTLDGLADFKEKDSLRSFAGRAVYEKKFIFTPDDGDPGRYEYLDLGEVHGVSEATLNGHHLGTRWYGIHRYALQDVLEPGENILRVAVHTALGNYCKSLEKNPVAQRWTAHQVFQSAGLVGPVGMG